MSDKPVVLYVEDNQANFEVAELRLRKRFHLLHAANDLTACALLTKHRDELTAVLMDIELQGSALDGVKLTRLLRGTLPETERPAYAKTVVAQKTPVYVLTAYNGQYPESLLLEAGADGYFTKPVDFIKVALAIASTSAKNAIAELKSS